VQNAAPERVVAEIETMLGGEKEKTA
jgi:hypothetical protein